MALTESENSQRLAAPSGGLSGRVRAWLTDSSHNSIAQRTAGSAFIIRVGSAALIYLSQILFARWMGAHEFGIYVYVWTWVLVIGELSDLGLSSAAQRFIPEYTKRNAHGLLRGFIVYSCWISVGAAAAMAGAGVLVIKLIEPWLAPYLVLPLMLACAVLPFYAFMQILDGIARSYDWVNLALLPIYVIRHVVVLVLMFAAYAAGMKTDAVSLVAIVGISLMLTSIGQAIAIRRRLARRIEPGPKDAKVGTWLRTSLPILMVGGFYLLLAHTDILVLQHFRTPEEVGIFYAASKTLALVSFVYFAVSAAAAHRFTEYHVTGDRERLASFLADTIRWTFWPSVAATALILLAGKPLLMLFGPSFAQGYHLMFILAVGLVARAAVGPIERLLSMLGEQRVCALVYATAFVLNLVMCLVLIPRFGLEGAAVSTASALLFESVALFWVTRKRLGLHALVIGRRGPA